MSLMIITSVLAHQNRALDAQSLLSRMITRCLVSGVPIENLRLQNHLAKHQK